MRKTLLAVALALVALLAPAAASAVAHTPILFVHGWSESESLWSTMITRTQPVVATACV